MNIWEEEKISFSGHDSFPCRNVWLKKGYDFIKNGNNFNSEDAVVELGVGKNMVSAIRYWMRAFDLTDSDNNLTDLAEFIFANDGKDPYLEDIATLWLLHFHLVSKAYASVYNIIFNEFRRERTEFDFVQFLNYLKRKQDLGKVSFSENSVKTDFSVFTRMYASDDEPTSDIEELLVNLLSDLQLVNKKNKRFSIQNDERKSLPDEIILYAILKQNEGSSISVSVLENQLNNVCSIFALNRSGLQSKIEDIIASNNGTITYNDEAGIRVMQFKNNRPEPFEILNRYYAH
jgi:hypothetical protein